MTINKDFKKLMLFIGIIAAYFLYENILINLISLFLGLFNISFNSINLILKCIILIFIESVFILSLVMFNYQYFKEQFKNFKKDWENMLDTGLKWWFLGLIIMIVSNILILLLSPSNTAQNQDTIVKMIEIVPFYILFTASIYAPIVEETIFRKYFRDVFQSNILFILMSGLTFGALHVVSGMDSFINLIHIIPYSALGIAFAIMYVKTNNIFPSIFFHFLHNTASTIIIIVGMFL